MPAMAVYDLWWNPAVEVQATDRAYRIGQEKNVNVYRLITEATFEEKINELLTSKQELFNLSVKQGETWITEMSDDQLKDLVALGR
jgi:SNF2 family DNA or RNA helicase